MTDLDLYLIDDVATEGINFDVYKTWKEHEKRWNSFVKEGKKLLKSGNKKEAKTRFESAANEAKDLKSIIESMPQSKSAATLTMVFRFLTIALGLAVGIYDIGVLRHNSKLENVPKGLTAYNNTATVLTNASTTYQISRTTKQIVDMKKAHKQLSSERELRPNDYNLYINQCIKACNTLIETCNKLATECSE